MSKLKNFFKLSKKKVHDDDKTEIGRLISSETPFAIREAYAKLSTNIMYLPSDTKCKTIVITSAMPGEGKSILSANLSISLSKLIGNGKVLLIDSDMRKSRINRLFQIDQDGNRGLSEYLAGMDAEPVIHRVPEFDNFFILNAGAKNPNPSGLITSSRLSDLFARLKEEYDYIIIDTPPVGAVTDALLYSSVVNGYIISVRADYSNINLVKETISSIKGVDGTVFGVVLNSFNPKLDNRGKYYGSYRSYKSYGSYGSYGSYES